MRPLSLLLGLVPACVYALASTDEVQDADPAQSGYLDNHNMHPATVGSSIFGILWKNQYAAKERWYAKPLVYTPPGAKQLVFLASTMNIIRTLDAVNGTLLNSRTLQPPFLQSDIGCTDIPDFIGVVGTPIIDPNTNTAYFFSKGYQNGAASGGVALGVYQFYAVDVQTLQDKPGFPILIDGHFADNDNARYFIGGTVLQRPALAMVNGMIIGGFGGHCDLFNYTGMLISVSPTPGVGVVSLYAMEASPGAPPVVTDIFDQKGGKAGIWQGGMGVAVDGNRLYLSTGNGLGHENGEVPASGRSPLSTLDEVVGSFTVSSTGKLALVDYFEPYEYISMDAADRDLGSGGVSLLDPTVFKGTGVSRMAITIGKNGKAYILNANNLGGFKQGQGGTDNIIQTIIADGAVFGGCGSYPLEGGYVYFTPVGFPTVCYKMGQDLQGIPQFTKVAQTATNGAGRVGIGPATITSYKGQSGTGILWISDPNAGLQAFNAVPKDGVLVPIPIPPTGGLNKFLRPAFGDGRVYVTDTKGGVVCLGSPVALPLQCSQPVNFGDVAIGSTLTVTVNCTTLIAIKSINGCTVDDATFQCDNSTLPKGALAQGVSFKFPVTWNLTLASVENAKNASFATVLPGIVGASLNIYTTNAVAKYSSVQPLSLTGSTVSKNAFLNIAPPEVDLGGIVVGSDGATSGLSAALILSNIGSQPLIFLGSASMQNSDDDDGPVKYTNITNGDLGSGFSSISLPEVGDQIAPGASLTVPLKFLASQVGAFSTVVVWWTTGGVGNALLTASAATVPIANISVSTASQGWDFSTPVKLAFGRVPAGTTQSRDIRICNSGGSSLTVTKSKPPISTELLAPNAGTDLHEGQVIALNSCALGQVSIVAAPLGVNQPEHSLSDAWILNVDDITFGVRDVAVTATVFARQVGPLLQDGSARYKYLGCYYDGAGRQLSQKYVNAANENGNCQQTCLSAGYKFAGTQYRTECWCGNTPPLASKFSADSLKKCGYACAGDTTQACGGPQAYESIFYDSLYYSIGNDPIPVLTTLSPSSSTSTSVSQSTTSRITTTTLSTTAATTSASSSTTAATTTTSSSSSTTTTSSSSSSATTATTTAPTTSPTTSSTTTTTLITTTTTASTTSPTTTTTLITTTTTATTTSSISQTATQTQTVLGFTPVGCFSDPAGGPWAGHNMPKLFSNDSMTPSLCISSALARLSAKPATTYKFVGLEYGRECYAATTAPSPQPTSLVGSKACTKICQGETGSQTTGASSTRDMCGAGNQYNMWVLTDVPLVGTGTGMWPTAPATATP